MPMPKDFKSPPIHRTPLYRAKAAYCGMQARCGNANGKNPAYAEVELRMLLEDWLAWAVPRYEEFDQRHPGQSPAAARKGDAGHYELGNIEIITFVENRRRMEVPRIGTLLNSAGMKVCSRCELEKPGAAFSKHRRSADGLTGWCRGCHAEHRQIAKLRLG